MIDFFLLGAPKAGTTSLFEYLNQHPDIYPSRFKETRFFLDQKLFERGSEFYLKKYFSGSEAYKIKGEGTPAYLGNCNVVAPRMKEVFGNHNPKFIIVLRDPVQRAWSNYQHRKRMEAEKMTFEEALEDEENRKKNGKGIFFQYFNGGLYGKQLSEWLAYYPIENFSIHRYEEFKDTDRLLKNIFGFLGVDPSIQVDNKRKKNTAGEVKFKRLNSWMSSSPKIVGKTFRALIPIHLQKEVRTRIRQSLIRPTASYKPEIIPDDVAERLRRRYIEDIELFESITKMDLSTWKKK